jgi:hypothetical protein
LVEGFAFSGAALAAVLLSGIIVSFQKCSATK